MRINNRFGLTLTLIVATAITSTPVKANITTTSSNQTLTQPAKETKVLLANTTQVNPTLKTKIKIIQPGGSIHGKDGDFKDKNPAFVQAPTFGEAGGGAFVNFKKETPGFERLNPAQKVNPSSAVRKMQKIQNNGR
jgi:hypothetical protein